MSAYLSLQVEKEDENEMNLRNAIKGKLLAIITICILCSTGCSGLRVNIPVEVGPIVKRENAALLILVENNSTYQIKITYPVSTGMIKQGQSMVFRLLRPDNYKVVVTAYAPDPNYPNVCRLVKTVEIPVFLNGYDIVKAKDTYVGYYLAVTDGMLFQNK